MHSVGNVLLGPRKARQHVVMTLVTCQFYIGWSVLYYAFLLPRGLVTAPHAHLLLTLNAVGLLFYPCVRIIHMQGRWLASFVVVQNLYGVCVLLVDYLFIPMLGPAALHLICCSYLFSFAALKPRALFWTGVGISAGLLAFFCVLATTGADGWRAAENSLGLGFSAAAVLALAFIGRQHSSARQRVWAQKHALRRVLGDIERLATCDPLTALHNRRKAEALLQAAVDGGGIFSLALIDLDDFKQVNDLHGHNVGDEVLCELGRVAGRVLRESDTIARWGGEEFLLLFAQTNGADATVATDRLRDAFSKAEIASPDGAIRVGFSAGVAEHAPGTPLAATLALADAALYAAKAAGKGRCELSAARSVDAPAPTPVHEERGEPAMASERRRH